MNAMNRTPTERIGDLFEAIGTLKSPNPDPEILARFPGWGVAPKVFTNDPASAFIRRGREFVAETLTDMELAGARAATLNQMFTPPWLVALVWRSLATLGFKNGSVLDLGCGIGQFNCEIPEGLQADYVGVEKDAVTAAIARILHPGANIYRADALAWKYPSGQFQAVIGNIPFEDGSMATYGGDFPYRVGLHARLILKGVDMLADGGLMALITTTGTLDSRGAKSEYTLFRQHLFRKGAFLGAVRIPEGAFTATSKTVDLILFRKGEQASRYNSMAAMSLPTAMAGPDEKPIYLNRFFQECPEFLIGEPYPDRASYGTSYGTRWLGTLEALECAIDAAAQKLAGQSQTQTQSQLQPEPEAIMTTTTAMYTPRFSWMQASVDDEPVAPTPSNVVPIIRPPAAEPAAVPTPEVSAVKLPDQAVPAAAESETWKRFQVDFARVKTGFVEICFGDEKPPKHVRTAIGRAGLGFSFVAKPVPRWYGPLTEESLQYLSDLSVVCGCPLADRAHNPARMTAELARLSTQTADEGTAVDATFVMEEAAPLAAAAPIPEPPIPTPTESTADDWMSRLLAGDFDDDIEAEIAAMSDRPYSRLVPPPPRNTRMVELLCISARLNYLRLYRMIQLVAVKLEAERPKAAAPTAGPTAATPTTEVKKPRTRSVD
jgi:SAM-dependent methyltransferase